MSAAITIPKRTPRHPRAVEAAAFCAARELLRRGIQPVPIPFHQKGPRVKGWTHSRFDEAELPDYFADKMNVGVLLGDASGGLTDVDLDVAEAIRLAEEFLPLTEMIHGRKSKPRSHRWYVTQPAPRSARFKDTDGTCLLELRSNGLQTMVPPSTHPSGEVLVWQSGGEPALVEASALTGAVRHVAAAAILARHWPSVGSRHEASLALCGLLMGAGWMEEEVARYVAAVARTADDEEWQSRGRDAITTAQKVLKRERVTGKKRLAEILGRDVVALVLKWLELSLGKEETCVADFTQDGLALAFVGEHQNDLRYTAAWHRWYLWDGGRWVEDGKLKHFDVAREICRRSAVRNPKIKRTLKTAHTVASVVTLASSDQRIATVPEDWDAGKWLLNTPGGLVNLRTGELGSHDPAAMITKITAVGPEGDCPLWKEHINLVTGDRELATYLQRFAGYTLTGATNEESLAFLHGTGQNGKDTFLTTRHFS